MPGDGCLYDIPVQRLEYLDEDTASYPQVRWRRDLSVYYFDVAEVFVIGYVHFVAHRLVAVEITPHAYFRSQSEHPF